MNISIVYYDTHKCSRQNVKIMLQNSSLSDSHNVVFYVSTRFPNDQLMWKSLRCWCRCWWSKPGLFLSLFAQSCLPGKYQEWFITIIKDISHDEDFTITKIFNLLFRESNNLEIVKTTQTDSFFSLWTWSIFWCGFNS